MNLEPNKKCLLRRGNLINGKTLKRCRHCEAHDEFRIEEKCLLRRGNLLNRMGL